MGEGSTKVSVSEAYAGAKLSVTMAIVMRQTRGNVSAQNGATSSEAKLRQASQKADAELVRIHELIMAA